MNITEFARTSRIPRRILSLLATKEIIQNPLSRQNVAELQFLEKIWCNNALLLSQLSKLNKQERQALVDTCHLASKWERYAYSRWKNKQAGERITMAKVIHEIELTYRFKLTIHQMRRLYQIRKSIYNQKANQPRCGAMELLDSGNK